MRRSIVKSFLQDVHLEAAELVSVKLQAGLGLRGSHLDVRAGSYEAVMREVPNFSSDRVCTSSER